MNLIESSHSDILFFFPEDSKASLDGAENGVVYKDGRSYTVIDHAIAIKNQSTVSKVIKNWGLLIAGMCFSSLAARANSPMATFAFSFLSGYFITLGLMIRLGLKAKIIPPKIIEPELIKEARKEAKAKGMVAFCSMEKERPFKLSTLAFTNHELRSYLEKDSENYTLDQLVSLLGWAFLSNHFSKNLLEKKMKEDVAA